MEPSGRSMGRFLREELTAPLGADVFLGLSEEEQARRHIADVRAPTDQQVHKDVKPTSPCPTVG